jgi:hypothetical protein
MFVLTELIYPILFTILIINKKQLKINKIGIPFTSFTTLLLLIFLLILKFGSYVYYSFKFKKKK